MAVAPSACGAFTSAFCWIRDLTAARSPFMAASATGLGAASAAEQNTAAQTAKKQGARIFDFSLHETRQTAVAIPDGILMDAVHVENAQQQVAGGNGLGFVVQVA